MQIVSTAFSIYKSEHRRIARVSKVIEFDGERIGKIAFGFHSGVNEHKISFREAKCWVSSDFIYDRLAMIQIPMRRKFSILIVSEKIFENDTIAGFEIIVLVCFRKLHGI